MSYWLLMIAALVCMSGAFFHGVLGHLRYITAVNNSNLEPLTKSLSLVSWHIFTIFLLVCTATLVAVAYRPELQIVAYPIIIANLFGGLLFIFLALIGHGRLLRLPGCYIMLLTAILAYLAITL